MAASLTEVKIQPKRRINELEDITNSNGYHNKKLKMSFKNLYFKSDDAQQSHSSSHPQQQRSPSPSDISSSPPKARSKTVSFELSHNKHYENSPLLTPKDEDDDYEEGGDGDIDNDAKIRKEREGREDRDATSDDSLSDLNTNPDYIALTSSLRLLNKSKEKIQDEIVQLSQLLEFHSNKTDRDEVIGFFMKLINNDLDLPKPHEIIKSPLIEWSKYHSGLADVNKDLEKKSEEDKPLFKTLNLFKSK